MCGRAWEGGCDFHARHACEPRQRASTSAIAVLCDCCGTKKGKEPCVGCSTHTRPGIGVASRRLAADGMRTTCPCGRARTRTGDSYDVDATSLRSVHSEHRRHRGERNMYVAACMDHACLRACAGHNVCLFKKNRALNPSGPRVPHCSHSAPGHDRGFYALWCKMDHERRTYIPKRQIV